MADGFGNLAFSDLQGIREGPKGDSEQKVPIHFNRPTSDGLNPIRCKPSLVVNQLTR